MQTNLAVVGKAPLAVEMVICKRCFRKELGGGEGMVAPLGSSDLQSALLCHPA